MKLQRRLQLLLATGMLLLYGFIATPVALWHHHTGDSSSTCFKDKMPGDKIVKSGHGCSICGHTYTPYIATEDVCRTNVQVIYIQHHTGFTAGVVPALLLQCNTRGSPLLA